MLFLGLAVILLTVLADQGSKYWIDAHLVTQQPIVFSNYFSLVKVWNSGVSFSMFSHYGHRGSVVLSVAALIICAFLLHWMYKETDKIKIMSLGLIVGGAIGNVIDRVRYEAVLDFLDFHYQHYHWPAFNVADTCICIGAFILIYLEIKNGRKKGLDVK